MSEELERRLAAIEERLAKIEAVVFAPQPSVEVIKACLDALRQPLNFASVLREPN